MTGRTGQAAAAAGVLAVAGVTLSSGFIWAEQGLLVQAFAATVLTWICYLSAHYLATGRIMDTGTGDATGHLLTSVSRFGGAIAGGLIFAAGVAVMAAGVHRTDHLLAAVGGDLFFAGYGLVHLAVTGDLL